MNCIQISLTLDAIKFKTIYEIVYAFYQIGTLPAVKKNSWSNKLSKQKYNKGRVWFTYAWYEILNMMQRGIERTSKAVTVKRKRELQLGIYELMTPLGSKAFWQKQTHSLSGESTQWWAVVNVIFVRPARLYDFPAKLRSIPLNYPVISYGYITVLYGHFQLQKRVKLRVLGKSNRVESSVAIF